MGASRTEECDGNKARLREKWKLPFLIALAINLLHVVYLDAGVFGVATKRRSEIWGFAYYYCGSTNGALASRTGPCDYRCSRTSCIGSGFLWAEWIGTRAPDLAISVLSEMND